MNTPAQSSPNLQAFEQWLNQQILTLSVDALKNNVLTCTACPKVMGDYIIEYKGESIRLPVGKAYAFLRYILDDASK
ncbi:MAG: hypothetical protein AAFO04_28575 [Cyanobacteria bacterium J06592_8]